MANEIMSVEGQLVGMPLAGPESFSQQQLDYLKRALGVDETVLFETTTPTTGTVATITLSESIYNFEKIKIVGRLNGNDSVGAPMEWEWYTNDIPVGARLNCFGVPLNDITNPSLGVYIRNSVEVVNNGTSLTHEHTYSWQLQGNSLMSQSTDVWGQLRYFRVVGIHRISGGN